MTPRFITPEKRRRDFSPRVRRGLRIVRWLAFILLAGHLIFAHGCHPGDHDEELFAPIHIGLP